jgi:hypothetical protein
MCNLRPALTLQEMGGWSDARMVRTYTHLAARHLLAHANAIQVPGTIQGTKNRRKHLK